MATISIPLGVNTVIRASDGHLAIDNGAITVIFALSSDETEAKRQLNLIITAAQDAMGRIAWRNEADSDPMEGLTAWSGQSATPRIEDAG